MTEQQTPYLNAELFKIKNDQLKEALSKIQGHICSFYFPPKAEMLFTSDWKRTLHLSKLLELEGTNSIIREIGQKLCLTTFTQPKSDTYYPFKHTDSEMAISLTSAEKTKFEGSLLDIFPVARAFLTKSLLSKVVSPLMSEGWTIYDASINLTSQFSATDKKNEILSPLNVHPGFSFQFRIFGSDLFIQILPACRLRYQKSVWDLLAAGRPADKILEQFPYVHIYSQGTQKQIEILSKTVSEPISEPPYFGRTYSEFAETMLRAEDIDPEAVLLRAASSRSGEVNYYPSSWAYPSFTFSSISYADEEYHSQLIGKLRTQGRKRIAEAQTWAKRFSQLEIQEQIVEIEPIPIALPYDPETLEPSKFTKTSFEIGRIFEPPSVTMLRYGTPAEIVQGVGTYQANVNALLSHEELKPLDVPNKLKLIVFVHAKLSNGWEKLKQALICGQKGYRGFTDTFGVELNLSEEVVRDFFSQEFADKIDSLPPQSYDCAIVIIPRYLETPEATSRIYTEVKTRIMTRGIPVQVITNDDRVTQGKNNTLEGKSRSTFALFGISLNILAKAGGVLAAIGESVASNLIPNSLTIGYDVARVIPKDIQGVKTVPLTAPLVIFDNRGAYVTHQKVYKLKDEVSLFEQYGDEIFEGIPSDITTVIVHKDGLFTDREQVSLKACAKKYSIEAIPISIRTSDVPRVVNPNYLESELGLVAGTVLPLCADNFLMMTTPFHNWDPDRLGWPNPILVTLHDSSDTLRKLQLLYHIFSLTKMQTGSQRATRLPVSTHFANMVSRFLRKVGDPNPEYLKYFVHTGSTGKNLPRWFL